MAPKSTFLTPDSAHLVVRDPLVRYYREHDDFQRYTVRDQTRRRAIAKLYSESKEYFGRRVLDIACGGGVLGEVIGGRGHEYIGIDKNPDMISAAKQHSSRPQNAFVLGDAKSTRLPGIFDTVAFLGNAAIHFSVSETSEILRNLEGNVHPGSHFIAEYRDVVSMLFDGKWGKRFVERRGDKLVTSLTKGIDPEAGRIDIESLAEGRRALGFTHAVWSPFILESAMAGLSWRLVKRRKTKEPYVWVDVYRKE